jgi:hypothetical protein
MLSFEKCKKILNKNSEKYSDEQIKQIMSLIDMWAKINSRTIINHLYKLENEKSGDNVKGVK